MPRPGLRLILIIMVAVIIWLPALSQPKEKQRPISTPKQTQATSAPHPFFQKNSTLQTTAFPTYTYPISDCFTYTYKATLGTNGQQAVIAETFTTRSGVTHIAGTVGAAGSKRGYVQQLAMDGTIAWSNSYSVAGRDLLISSIRESANQTLLIIGTSQLANGTDKRPYIAEIQPDGTISWSKTVNTPNYSGGYISASPYAGIAFVAYDATTVIYGKLDNTGNLQWMNRMAVLDNGAPISIENNAYDWWFITYSGALGGRRAGSIVAFDTNGSVMWKSNYGGTASSEYIIHDAEFTNNTVILSGIYNTNGGAYALFKSAIYTDGKTYYLQTFNVPGFTFTTTAQSDLTMFPGVIAFTPSTGYPEVFTVKSVIESNPPDVILWSMKFPVPAAFSLVNIERTFDAGLLVSGNITGGAATQGYLMKTDSIATIKDCPGASYQISNTFQFIPSNYTSVVATVSSMAGSVTNAGSSLSNASIPMGVTCKSLTCPERIELDTCYESFARRFRSANSCDLALDMLVDDQNNLTVAGIQRDNPYNSLFESGFFAEFDSKGKLTSRKKVLLGASSGFYDMMRLRDGNILAFGGSTIAKFNSNLQMLWNKTWNFGGPQSAYYGMVEAADGSIYINYVKGAPFICGPKISILKLNANGSFNWEREYAFPSKCTSGYIGSITQDDDYLYAVNYVLPEMGLMKIRKTDGSVVWSKAYEATWSDQTLFGKDISIIGDNLIFHGRTSTPTNVRDLIMIVDKNGQTRSKKLLDIYEPKMVVAKNGDIVLTSYEYPPKQLFIRLDSNFNVKYSKRIDLPGRAESLTEGADGSFYQLMSNFYADAYETDFSIIKYSPDGKVGECTSDTFPLKTFDPDVIEKNMQVTVTNTTVTFSSVGITELGYSLQENYLFCSKKSTCTELELEGPASVCDTLPFAVRTKRSIDCNAFVEYTIDNPDAKVISKSDTGIILQSKKSGAIKVKARMFTGCVWLEDEVDIAVNIINTKFLNIGRDTILCGTQPVVVNAGKGYVSYLWNTGSTDSTIAITMPGRYFIDVTDVCNKKISDTINVAPPSTNPFNVGGDQSVCSNEIVSLSAPQGFINYSWRSDDGSFSSSVRQVNVQPNADVEYYARAERRPGCFVFDTLNVQVTAAPPLDLGNDQAFCELDSAVLDAGNSFVSYAWNNGANTASVAAKQTGKYSVIATSAEGCKVYDTVEVTVWEGPQPQLRDVEVLCEGEDAVLNAGAGYQSYIWQDGSMTSIYRVAAPGKYYVNVTDNRGCKGSDTAVVKRVAPSPTNFLPSDTAVCSYGEVLIAATEQEYKSYQWSNGDRARTIKVKQPGIYVLEVSDVNNCVGRDSISVAAKDCMEGFYVPNAFTPNNDGNNDTFKPVLLGEVTKYQFSVFDRWGNMIFTTTSIEAAWNGWVNGKRADGGTYVWQCSYTFAGGKPEFEKGWVQLVR